MYIFILINLVLDFWEFYGTDNIRKYLYKTARDAGECVCVYMCMFEYLINIWLITFWIAGQLLKEAWGTSLPADPSMFGSMVLVELPDGLLPPDSGVRVEPPFDDKSADMLQDILHHDYKIEV